MAVNVTDRPTDRPSTKRADRPSGACSPGSADSILGMERAGFDVRWQVEIEPDAVAVLMHHWPTVRRFRDIDAVVHGKHRQRQAHGLVLPPVDVIVGGFPCQDVSVAGQRKGLAGSRSGLFFAFMRALRLMRAQFGKPDWVVIENVPGLLTSHGGADFHTVLSEVADCGFRRAYRILDSRFFGVPQRRRRVFIVGHRGTDGERARAVLFESAGRHRHPATRGTTRARVAASLRSRAHGRGVNAPGRGGEDDSNLIPALAFALDASHGSHIGQGHNTTYLPVAGPLGGGNDGIGRRSEDDPNLIAATLNSSGNDGGFRTEPGEHLIVSSSGERARALTASCYKRHDEDTDTLIAGAVLSGPHGYAPEPGEGIVVASPVTASAGHHGHSSPRGDGRDNIIFGIGSHAGAAEGIQTNSRHKGGGAVGFGIREDEANCLRSGQQGRIGGERTGVRRLTPLECERLQGFPDGWTCLCGVTPYSTTTCTCSDTPRYKGLGNAVTVNVAEWIGRRLKAQIAEALA